MRPWVPCVLRGKAGSEKVFDEKLPGPQLQLGVSDSHCSSLFLRKVLTPFSADMDVLGTSWDLRTVFLRVRAWQRDVLTKSNGILIY